MRRSSKLETDLTDAVVRVIDATWSGLKFVIPVKGR
jgi:hypothetical protein